MIDPGFYVDEERAVVKWWSPKLDGVLASGKIDTVWIDGWGEPTLDALVPFRRWIQRIVLRDPTITDLSALAQLTRLADLFIGEGQGSWSDDALEAIDFSRLKRLEKVSLSGNWPWFGNLRECRALVSLNITGCALRDLTRLSALSRLERLEISEAPLRSLAGIDGLQSLEWLRLRQAPLERLDGLRHARRLGEIGLYNLRKLQSVAELAALPVLRTLEIDGSKKIADLDRLGELHQLQRLDLLGVGPLSAPDFLSRLKGLKDLRLINVGQLPSLNFLRGLDALELFAAADKTVVRDGNMAVLLELPALKRVLYTDRRHYSPPRPEIEAALAARNIEAVGES